MLGFLGNRLPDHEARVDEFFFKAARRLPAEQFLLGGSGWQDNAPELANVRYLGPVSVRDHNVFNSSPLTILNVSRQSMAGTGCSPPPRIFEAAGSGACLITDAWQGIELFLEPGREVLIARDGDHVVEHLLRLTPTHARILGDAARKRLLAGHTYAQRAAQVESVLLAGTAVALAS
jgi:spore maturation protein CgeB